MIVRLTNRNGGQGVQLIPQTDTESDYLVNLDKDYLKASWTPMGEMFTLELNPEYPSVPVKMPKK